MHQENELFGFGDFHTKDESPIDNTQITTTLLYYSQEELKEIKILGKKLLKKHFPDNYMESNLSDLILKIFRDENS